MTTHQLSILKIIILGSLLCTGWFSQAAKVAGSKGRKVYVVLEGEPAKKGDLFYLVNKQGKKRAIIKIMAVKGDKAIALLGKGKAKKGFTLVYRPRKGKDGKPPKQMAEKKDGTPQEPAMAKPGSSGKSKDFYWGIIGGFAQDSMEVQLKDDDGNDRQSVSMDGNGFSFKALMDYKLLDGVWFRGMTGVEQFVTTGSDLCGNSENATCETDIMYLSLDLWARYVFSEKKFRPWAGAGFSLLVPLSKTSTALAESSITNTSVMAAGLGVDWFTSETFYIPIQFEYGLLPSSDDVNASLIAFRIGAGFSF